MTKKICETMEQAWELQETRDDEPHGWIQWKGTDLCMDLRCGCGEISHIDCAFVYSVKCPNCGKVYFLNGHIELIEITKPDGQEKSAE